MKLLFDQNLSYKLVDLLHISFPDSKHVRWLSLDTARDNEIWEYAKKHTFTLVTQDVDFTELLLKYGPPA